jgi:hypothetical protein
MKQFLYLAILFWIAACNVSSKDYPSSMNGEQVAANNEELSDTGLVTQIAERAYPMFLVTMEFSERKQVLQFDIVLSDVAKDAEELNALLNKYVAIQYMRESLPMLIDIQPEGASIRGEPVTDLKQKNAIIGVLSGAELPSSGDLPSTFSITQNDGNVMDFSYFITQSMTKGNGREVTVFYDLVEKNIITKIVVASDDYEAKACRTSSSTIEDIPEYDMPFEEVSFLIIQSTKDYYVALATAKKVSKFLGLEVKLNGVYKKGKGLVYTEECGCGIIHDYIPRGRFDDGNFVSIEQTDSYKEFTNGYFIVVAGSGDRKNLTPLLKKVKKIVC